MRRLALALAVLLFAPLAHAIKITTTLPPFTRKTEINKARSSDGRIERIRQQYLRRAKAGELDQPSEKKLAEEKQLLDFAKQINAKLSAQKDDRPILVIVEGPDGAGKSSTMARLEPVFEGIKKVDELHFGAPPKDAEKVHWVKRFIESLPQKGGVMMWDRSYIGRAVYDVHYGFSDKALRKQTLREIRDLEGLLRDKVRIVKFYMDTPGENLARTIAKREVTAPEKLSDSDYLSYRDRKTIKKLFKTAIRETDREVKWHVIDMSDRFEGRMEMLKILKRELAD
jgi:polyphosphate kinase 2 (PPK2 family)